MLMEIERGAVYKEGLRLLTNHTIWLFLARLLATTIS